MSLGITDLLKEGTKHLSGVSEVVITNIEAVKQFAQIVRTSLGPNGMNKMIVNHLQKLFVTSDAATIIKELDVAHPAARIVVLASQMQEQEFGDGTNFTLVFCGELLQNAEALLQLGLHPSEIILGYNKASQKVADLLEELATIKCDDMKNPDVVGKFIRSAVAAKQYGFEDKLCPIIAKACIEVCPKNPEHFNVDNVRVAKVLGGGVLDTTVISGHVVVREVDTTIKKLTNAKIAVFAAGLDVSKPETKDTILIQNAEQLLNYNKSEEKYIEDIIKKIADSGAKVIVSGGAIGEMALHFIERYNMMALKVLSKYELRRICKAVGATPLIRLGAPTAEELGFADLISQEEIGSTKVTVFRSVSAEKSGISTIIVRASTQNMLDDIERAIDDGVNTFKSLCKDPRVVPGAGATEIELAKKLGDFANTNAGLSQFAIKKYAEAFEVIPRTLAENAGQKSIEAIASLYAAHNKSSANEGINIETGGLSDAVQMGVFDLFSTKASAIRLATHAAITILQVDQIIMSKPAGGPKMPKQGPVDAE